MSHPRTLYIGEHPIGSKISTGVTLANLYEGYPPELVAQFTNPIEGSPVFGRMIAIPRNVAPFAAPAAAAARFYLKHRPKASARLEIPHNSIPQHRPSIRTRVLSNLSAATDVSRVRIDAATLRDLRDHEPQVIHAVIGRVRALQMTLEASKQLRIPIVPHFTDDWVSTIYTSGELGGYARRRTMQLVGEMLDRSPVLLVIGDAMAEEYGKRFSKRCFVASAGIEPEDFQNLYTPGSNPKRLVYVGSPLIGRASLADAVGKYAKTRGWEVVVYPMLPEQWRQTTTHVRVEEQIAPEDVPRELQKADALLFPESTDAATAAYTRLSFSTKAAQLIAAGRPVLAIGPRTQGSIQEIGRHAPRSVLLDGISESGLAGAFDFLDSQLDGTTTVVPAKYFSSSMRRSFVEALHAGAASRAPRPLR